MEKIIEIPTEFKSLFNNDWREAAVYGGRYSLKSHTVARYLLIQARLKKTRIACFREFQNSIAESSHQLLSDLIKQYELNDFEVTQNTIINRVTGSDFIFKGLWNNEQTIKSIEGIDIAWVEEAQTVSKASLEVLTPTIRQEGSKIVYTYNRLLPSDPVHERLVVEGRPNTLIINVNYDIAEKYGWLPDVIKQEIEDDKLHRPTLYKQKWLGEPFISANDLLKEKDLVRCLSNQINSQQGRIVIGMDTGHDLHFTMLNKEGAFYYKKCLSVAEMKGGPGYDPYDEVDRILRENPKSILVCDQGGDLIGPRKLQAKYKGRVFLVFSNKESKTQKLINLKENADGFLELHIDRNRCVQLMVDQINEGRATFNGTKDDWQEFFNHCLNIYRVKEIQGEDENDPQYGWRYVWKRKGPDHFFFSWLYAVVGMDALGSDDKAQIVGKGGGMTAGIPIGYMADKGQVIRRKDNFEI